MRTIGLAAIALLAFTATLLAAGNQAPDVNAARAFIVKLYSHYPAPAGGGNFQPTDKDAPSVFDPGMVALFKEDTRLANGEVGFVDADPICMCQDDSGLKPKIVSVTMNGSAAATAVVDLVYTGEPKPQKPNLLTLHLVVVNGQWRIYDLSMGDVKSYRSDLAKANKEAAAEHH
ncbi:MAG TPA: DUF3828 domain-containing protein [Rhizomicrobium sp.]|nr:DUF3828 domain-containing protein [Rhizomicrobium sp.]